MIRTQERPKAQGSRRVDRPVFVVGAERSGTTLLELMLEGHPQIAWAGEFEYAVDFVSDGGEWPPLAMYHQFLSVDRVFLAPNFTLNRRLDYRELVNSFLIQARDRKKRPIVGATVHRNFDRLLKLWPNATFIHIVRDGRDTARSRIEMGWAGNVWTASFAWLEVELLWDKMKESIPEERRLEIRYEDLARSPVETLTAICKFMGVEYDAGMLDYPKRSTYSHPDPSLTEQWRKKLSPRDLGLLESSIGPMLRSRAYPPSEVAAVPVAGLLTQRLWLQDRWARMRFRQKRFGWKLWLADVLLRRVGASQVHRAVQRKINAIETLHLK